LPFKVAEVMGMPKLLIVALVGAGAIVMGGPGGLGPLVIAIGAALVVESVFGAIVLAAQRRSPVFRTFAVRRAMAMTVLGLALVGAALAAGTGVRQAPGASGRATAASSSSGSPAPAP
jgi:hypothetical protein